MRFVTEKFEFIPNQESEKILLDNCDYRIFLYNECIRYIINNKRDGQLIYSKYEMLKYIRDKFEKTNENRPEYLKDYDYYFRGISAIVARDVDIMCQLVIEHRKQGLSADVKFLNYLDYCKSFSFENKVDRNATKNKFGNYTGNRLVLTNNPYIIGLKINKEYSKKKYVLGIHLKENIFYRMKKDMWDLDTIHEIRIKYHNGKWYIHFVVEYKDRIKIIKDHRKLICGIDLGETNPVMIYDHNGPVEIPKELNYPKEKINQLQHRISRLQSIMDNKIKGSNNYNKVKKKYYKSWDKLTNIKKEWHFNLALWIAKSYRNVVVDEFNNHIIKKVETDYTGKKRRNCNRSMFNKGMSHFMKILRHECDKYHCNYYMPNNDTTNKCSNCGNVNNIKLVIDGNKRDDIFVCENCGYTIDRDVNASKNCYQYFFTNDIIKFEYDGQH